MVQVGNISIKLGIKSTISKDVAAAESALGKLRISAQTTSKKFTDLGKAMMLKVGVPLMLIGGAATKTAVDFDDAMRQVQAVTSATGDDFIRLTELARQLGEDTSFAATDAAAGMLYLGRAGFTTNQILAAIPDTLNLARATATDLGTTADIMSNIMTAFKIPAENAAGAVDILAKATNSSNTNLVQLGDAMSYVAPIAKGYGWTLEETAAAAGFLSNAGIQASMAGTSLRGALSSLASPSSDAQAALNQYGISLQSVDPLTHSFAEILGTLNQAGVNVTDTLRIFGLRAGPGSAALMAEGQQSLEDYIGVLQNADGYAAQAAKGMDEGPGGAIRRLKSSLESLRIEFGTVIATALEPSIEKFRELTNWLTNISPASQKVIVFAGIAAVAISVLVVGVGILSGSLLAAASAVTTFIIPALGAVIPLLATVGLPLIAIAGTLYILEKKFGAVTTVLTFFKDTLTITWDWLKKVGSVLKEKIVEQLSKVKEAVDSALQGLADLFEFLEPLGGSLGEGVSGFLDKWHEKAEAIRAKNAEVTAGIVEQTSALNDLYGTTPTGGAGEPGTVTGSGGIPGYAGRWNPNIGAAEYDENGVRTENGLTIHAPKIQDMSPSLAETTTATTGTTGATAATPTASLVAPDTALLKEIQKLTAENRDILKEVINVRGEILQTGKDICKALDSYKARMSSMGGFTPGGSL